MNIRRPPVATLGAVRPTRSRDASALARGPTPGRTEVHGAESGDHPGRDGGGGLQLDVGGGGVPRRPAGDRVRHRDRGDHGGAAARRRRGRTRAPRPRGVSRSTGRGPDRRQVPVDRAWRRRPLPQAAPPRRPGRARAGNHRRDVRRGVPRQAGTRPAGRHQPADQDPVPDAGESFRRDAGRRRSRGHGSGDPARDPRHPRPAQPGRGCHDGARRRGRGPARRLPRPPVAGPHPCGRAARAAAARLLPDRRLQRPRDHDGQEGLRQDRRSRRRGSGGRRPQRAAPRSGGARARRGTGVRPEGRGRPGEDRRPRPAVLPGGRVRQMRAGCATRSRAARPASRSGPRSRSAGNRGW